MASLAALKWAPLCDIAFDTRTKKNALKTILATSQLDTAQKLLTDLCNKLSDPTAQVDPDACRLLIGLLKQDASMKHFPILAGILRAAVLRDGFPLTNESAVILANLLLDTLNDKNEHAVLGVLANLLSLPYLKVWAREPNLWNAIGSRLMINKNASMRILTATVAYNAARWLIDQEENSRQFNMLASSLLTGSQLRLDVNSDLLRATEQQLHAGEAAVEAARARQEADVASTSSNIVTERAPASTSTLAQQTTTIRENPAEEHANVLVATQAALGSAQASTVENTTVLAEQLAQLSTEQHKSNRGALSVREPSKGSDLIHAGMHLLLAAILLLAPSCEPQVSHFLESLRSWSSSHELRNAADEFVEFVLQDQVKDVEKRFKVWLTKNEQHAVATNAGSDKAAPASLYTPVPPQRGDSQAGPVPSTNRSAVGGGAHQIVVPAAPGSHVKQLSPNSKVHKSIPAALSQLEEWMDIPMFSVVTGANGAGKSKLLQLLQEQGQAAGCSVVFPSPHEKTNTTAQKGSAAQTASSAQPATILAEIVDSIKGTAEKTGSEAREIVIERFNTLLSRCEMPIKAEWTGTKVLLRHLKYSGDGSEDFALDALSSGQKSMIVLLAECLRSRLVKSPKLLLYDELDKFFDPLLISTAMRQLRELSVECGCQVVLVTHRPDTIAIVASVFNTDTTRLQRADNHQHKVDFGIFLLQDDQPVAQTAAASTGTAPADRKRVVEVTPVHAMYRLTRGFRKFSGHHFRVLVESLDDALFYEGAYERLLLMAELVPRHSVHKRCWQPVGATEMERLRLLSRRFQLSFQSVSRDKRASGGCSEVLDKLTRECNAYVDRERLCSGAGRSLLSHREFQLPYGILDNDYAVGKKDVALNWEKPLFCRHNDRMVIARPIFTLRDKRDISVYAGARYSIENFIYDPLFISPLLSKQEMLAKRVKPALCDICDRIRSTLRTWLNLVESPSPAGKGSTAATEAMEGITDKSAQELQRLVDRYFQVVLTAVRSSADISNEQDAAIKLWLDAASECAQVQFLHESAVLSLLYPRVFFSIRGHAIETVCFHRSLTASVSLLMAELKLLPFDLVCVFLELNELVRRNLYRVVKPDQARMPPDSEQFHHVQVQHSRFQHFSSWEKLRSWLAMWKAPTSSMELYTLSRRHRDTFRSQALFITAQWTDDSRATSARRIHCVFHSAVLEQLGKKCLAILREEFGRDGSFVQQESPTFLAGWLVYRFQTGANDVPHRHSAVQLSDWLQIWTQRPQRSYFSTVTDGHSWSRFVIGFDEERSLLHLRQSRVMFFVAVGVALRLQNLRFVNESFDPLQLRKVMCQALPASASMPSYADYRVRVLEAIKDKKQVAELPVDSETNLLLRLEAARALADRRIAKADGAAAAAISGSALTSAQQPSTGDSGLSELDKSLFAAYQSDLRVRADMPLLDFDFEATQLAEHLDCTLAITPWNSGPNWDMLPAHTLGKDSKRNILKLARAGTKFGVFDIDHHHDMMQRLRSPLGHIGHSGAAAASAVPNTPPRAKAAVPHTLSYNDDWDEEEGAALDDAWGVGDGGDSVTSPSPAPTPRIAFGIVCGTESLGAHFSMSPAVTMNTASPSPEAFGSAAAAAGGLLLSGAPIPAAAASSPFGAHSSAFSAPTSSAFASTSPFENPFAARLSSTAACLPPSFGAPVLGAPAGSIADHAARGLLPLPSFELPKP